MALLLPPLPLSPLQEIILMAFNSKRHFTNLRDVLASTRHSEYLSTIPDRLEAIFRLYDELNLSPDARQDIYQLLNSTCSLAEALTDSTFPADRASHEVSLILQVLARVNSHLASRPALTGFIVLHPDTGAIMSQFFHSDTEAHLHRNRMLTMGMTPRCQVVAARLISEHVVQPLHRRLSPPPLPPTKDEVVVENPLPSASETLAQAADAIAAAHTKGTS